MPCYIELKTGRCPYCGNVGFRIDFDDLREFEKTGTTTVQCVKCRRYAILKHEKKEGE